MKSQTYTEAPMWVPAVMDGHWPTPDPSHKHIGKGSRVHVLRVIREELLPTP